MCSNAPNIRLLPCLEDVLCLFISSAAPEELLPTDFVLDLVDRQHVDRLAKRAGRMEHPRVNLGLRYLLQGVVHRVVGELPVVRRPSDVRSVHGDRCNGLQTR